MIIHETISMTYCYGNLNLTYSENQAAQGLVDDIGEHGAQKHQTVIGRKEALAHVSWIALPQIMCLMK